jgi:hypothetical protein
LLLRNCTTCKTQPAPRLTIFRLLGQQGGGLLIASLIHPGSFSFRQVRPGRYLAYAAVPPTRDKKGRIVRPARAYRGLVTIGKGKSQQLVLTRLANRKGG